MNKQRLNDILRPWLARLKSPSSPTGEDISDIPAPIRIVLLKRGLAHLRDGRIEITFAGIKELHRMVAAADRNNADEDQERGLSAQMVLQMALANGYRSN